MRTILVIPKLKREANYATAIRSAEAFGVTELCFIGITEIPNYIKRGCLQTQQFIKTSFFETNQDCIKYLYKEHVSIICIENSEDAQLITDFRFRPNTAFVMGMELGVADDFLSVGKHLKIPQFGVVNCLNTSVASSIILYERFKQNLKI